MEDSRSFNQDSSSQSRRSRSRSRSPRLQPAVFNSNSPDYTTTATATATTTTTLYVQKNCIKGPEDAKLLDRGNYLVTNGEKMPGDEGKPQAVEVHWMPEGKSLKGVVDLVFAHGCAAFDPAAKWIELENAGFLRELSVARVASGIKWEKVEGSHEAFQTSTYPPLIDSKMYNVDFFHEIPGPANWSEVVNGKNKIGYQRRGRGFHLDSDFLLRSDDGKHVPENGPQTVTPAIFQERLKQFLRGEADTPFPVRARPNVWGNILNRKQLVVVPSSNLEKAGVHEDDYNTFVGKVIREDNLDVTVSLLRNSFVSKPGHHVLFFSDSLPHMALSNWNETLRLKQPRDEMEHRLADAVLQWNTKHTDENRPVDTAANALFDSSFSSWSLYENDSNRSGLLLQAIVENLQEQGYYKNLPEQGY